MNKILFSSKNVYTLLSIRTVTFLNVFVSFRYRKLYYRTFLLRNFAFVRRTEKGFTGQGKGIQGARDAMYRRDPGQKGCRTGGIQDRRDTGQVGCRTGGMQDR